jgi:aminoglycoside phosphotransferase (APT) family kinase protein
MGDATAGPALERWLTEQYGAPVALTASATSSGAVNETRFLTVRAGGKTEDLVLKVMRPGSTVFSVEPSAERRIVAALHDAGAIVPPVRFFDESGDVLGMPFFIMARAPGRGVPDEGMLSYAGDGWFRDAAPELRRTLWHAFHDGLADLHRLPASILPLQPEGSPFAAWLAYWRSALLDVAEEAAVPVQLAALHWLARHAPPDVDASPRVCMGDARLANAVFDEERLSALVDWELGHVGNPAADIGYSLFTDRVFSDAAGGRLSGLPSASATWERWSARTGLLIADTHFWEVHGAIVLTVTATRAIAGMLKLGGSEQSVNEAMNPLAAMLAAMLEEEAT